MIYYTKEECYVDTLLSLRLGIVLEEDLKHLLDYYKQGEHYECCSGLVEAYKQFKTEKKVLDEQEESTERD